MKVLGVVWAGVRTEAFDETVEFFREVLGVPLVNVRPGFAWSKMPNSSQLEIFAADDSHHQHFTTGPVVEFLVEDVHAAAEELQAAGVELLGPLGGDAEEGWLHFRAPDGNVYGLASSPRTGASRRQLDRPLTDPFRPRRPGQVTLCYLPCSGSSHEREPLRIGPETARRGRRQPTFSETKAFVTLCYLLRVGNSTVRIGAKSSRKRRSWLTTTAVPS